MSLVSLRPILAPLFGAAICLAVSPRSGAAVKDLTIAQFAARAVSVSDAMDAGPIEIRIVRWSNDEELENLRGALSGPGTPLPVFQKARPPAGVVLMPGVRGGLGARVRQRRALNVEFAREIETPAGRQVVIATDQHLGLGESGHEAAASGPQFTLLDIRFGPDGKGVGKLAPAASVAYNKEKRIFEIENYTAQPVRLSEVRSEKP